MHLVRAALLPSLLIALLPITSACAKSAPDVPQARTVAATGDEGKAAGGESPPPGVDMSKLDDFERKVFYRVINKEASVCGKAHSLAQSLKSDKGCRKALYAVRYVARLVDSGFTDSEIGESLVKRFRAPRHTIDLSDCPVKGQANAPVTIVEFVDYECPHCKRVQPVLRQIMDEFKDDVKIYFKHYPIGGHTNARAAAEASVAAFRQSKFWPYNEKLWVISDSLTPAAMEQIAKDVGLDVAKWRVDAQSDETKARVQKDHDEGERLDIHSTPTIYINGRQFTDNRDVEGLRDWINEELGR